jgi:hypothetical protein
MSSRLSRPVSSVRGMDALIIIELDHDLHVLVDLIG